MLRIHPPGTGAGFADPRLPVPTPASGSLFLLSVPIRSAPWIVLTSEIRQRVRLFLSWSQGGDLLREWQTPCCVGSWSEGFWEPEENGSSHCPIVNWHLQGMKGEVLCVYLYFIIIESVFIIKQDRKNLQKYGKSVSVSPSRLHAHRLSSCLLCFPSFPGSPRSSPVPSSSPHGSGWRAALAWPSSVSPDRGHLGAFHTFTLTCRRFTNTSITC